MTSLPHTLDNLCKADKDKLMEMIKQLNEMKKRCAALEKEVENLQAENQRLIGREDVMKSQLEAMETKLFDAVEISKGSQARVEQLTQSLMKSEAGRKSARARYSEAQNEIGKLNDDIRELRLKHERIHVETEVQTKPPYCNRSMNTDDTQVNKIDEFVQVNTRDIDKSHIKIQSYSMSSSKQDEYSFMPSFATASNQSEIDEDISRIIAMLNV